MYIAKRSERFGALLRHIVWDIGRFGKGWYGNRCITMAVYGIRRYGYIIIKVYKNENFDHLFLTCRLGITKGGSPPRRPDAVWGDPESYQAGQNRHFIFHPDF